MRVADVPNSHPEESVLSRTRLLMAAVAAGGLLTASAAGGASNAFAQSAGVSAPTSSSLVSGSSDLELPETKPIYSYANAIRESVNVETTMDTDADGVHDTVAVDIIRPRELDLTGSKVPVIMDASPYYACCGRGNESETKS